MFRDMQHSTDPSSQRQTNAILPLSSARLGTHVQCLSTTGRGFHQATGATGTEEPLGTVGQSSPTTDHLARIGHAGWLVVGQRQGRTEGVPFADDRHELAHVRGVCRREVTRRGGTCLCHSQGVWHALPTWTTQQGLQG